jgi:hypothetical protein
VRNRLLSEADWDDATAPHAPEWEEKAMSDLTSPYQSIPWWVSEEPPSHAAADSSAKASEIRRIRPPAADGEEEVTVSMGRRATRAELESEPDSDPADALWVRNADRLVGPVSMALLLAGIAAGRVPRGSEVLSLRERIWRPLRSTTPFAEAFRNLDARVGIGRRSVR